MSLRDKADRRRLLFLLEIGGGFARRIRPRGFQIKATIRRPKISIPYLLGSKSAPKIICRKATCRKSSMPPIHDNAGKHNPDHRAHASQHHNGENHCALDEGEGFRRYEALSCGKKTARKATKHRTNCKVSQLCQRRVDTRARQAISSSRRASQARPRGRAAQAHGDNERDEAERQNDIIEKQDAVHRVEGKAKKGGKTLFSRCEGQAEKAWARYRGNASSAPCHGHPVNQHKTD